MKAVGGVTQSTGVVPDAESATQASAELAVAFPEPSFAGDPVAGALAAISRFAKSSRELSRTMQSARDSLRARKNAEEIRAMRDKADAIRSGALVGAAMLGASAGLHAASFDRSFGDLESSRVKADIKFLDGSAAVLKKGSELPNKFADAAATDHEADARSAASAAKTAQTEADAMGTNVESANEVIRKAHEAIKTILELRHSTEMAIINRRA